VNHFSSNCCVVLFLVKLFKQFLLQFPNFAISMNHFSSNCCVVGLEKKLRDGKMKEWKRSGEEEDETKHRYRVFFIFSF
jgi:hypothetical protein